MGQNVEQDFSGGITDYYLDPAPNKHAKLDNWLLTKDNTATVRPGGMLNDETYARAENGRPNKLFEFAGAVFKVISTKLWRYTASGWAHLKGPVASGDVAFPSATAASNMSVAQHNKHMILTSNAMVGRPRKAYLDSGGTWRIFTAGLPKLTWASTYPQFTASVAEAKNFLYYFVASREYTVDGGVVFEDFGPVTVVQALNMPDMALGGGRSITIAPSAGGGAATWPHPADTATDFYDQTNLKISIYRTKGDGTVGYFVARVNQGATGAYVDTTTDAALGAPVYIDGDVLDWDQPPIAKYVTQCQDIVWYANLIETETGSSVTRPYRIRQSIQQGPDKCPASFFTDVDGDITGFSSVGDFPIVFTATKCWRLEGFVDTQGNGFTRKILISDTVGCINNDSILQSQRGIAWAALDGFYFTDGYNVTRLSDDIALSYPQLLRDVVNLAGSTTVAKALRRSRINGAYDRMSDRYWWSVQVDTEKTDNDAYVIWDANYGAKTDASFTTASSGADMMPSASCFIDGNLYRTDNRGYLIVHKDEYLNDIQVESRTLATDWIEKCIPHDYMSSARSMGDSTITKWAQRLQSVFVNLTDISIQPQTTDDDQKVWYDMKEMRFRGHYVWGMPNLIWGDADAVWNYRSFIFFERRFPRGSLRFTYKQVRFIPAYTVILASGDTDLAACDLVAETVTLSGLESIFEDEHVGYFIHFEWDDYATAYEILAKNSTTEIDVDVAPGGFVDGSYKWEIRGYRKNERPVMRNHIGLFEMYGDSQRGWRRGDSGGNNG